MKHIPRIFMQFYFCLQRGFNFILYAKKDNFTKIFILTLNLILIAKKQW